MKEKFYFEVSSEVSIRVMLKMYEVDKISCILNVWVQLRPW
ncbi:hypothetical protein [Clostridium botulinum]|nr:hypothetical protein [Clostridium botulinum]